jgi:16S rRNA (guanine966-N2)-methyltransferase
MKIQTGDDKGREIHLPSTPSIRPSTNKVREALVDILRARKMLINVRVLDVFAGTGAVGFELLSNGAREVVFIEKSSVGVSTIRKNAEKLKKTERIRIIRDDAIKALQHLISSGEPCFDIIYADPPYNIDDSVIEKMFELGAVLLCRNGLLILEHSSKRTFSTHNLSLLTSKKYGDTILSFYGKEV